MYAKRLAWHVRIDLAYVLCCRSSAASGMCELTNQRWLGIHEAGGLKETGAKTGHFGQKGNTMMQHWTE